MLAFAALATALVPAAPAQAQTEVWSATLTVDVTGDSTGCSNNRTGMDRCSTATVLTDDDFEFFGATYTFHDLYFDDNKFHIGFDPNQVVPASVRNALTLHVGSTRIALSSLDWSRAANTNFGSIANPGLSWSDGDTVSLSLTADPTVVAEPTDATWSGQLNVSASNGWRFGCSNLPNANGTPSLKVCSKRRNLNDDEVTHGGVTRKVERLFWLKYVNELWLSFEGLSGADAKAAFAGMKLGAGGREFAFDDAEPVAGSGALVWAANLGWTNGETVPAWIAASPSDRPAKPSGFAVAPGDGEVVLTWDDPGDAGIVKYQYQHRVHYSGGRDTGWGPWTDIPDSGADTTEYTVTGLDNRAVPRDEFRIRAVNANGAGPASEPKRCPPADTTTAPADIWSATLTVSSSTDFNNPGRDFDGCLTSRRGTSTGIAACTSTQRLSDNTFTHLGIDYTVNGVYLYDPASNIFYLHFDLVGLTPSAAKTALSGLTLTVGTGATAQEFAFSAAEVVTDPTRNISVLRWKPSPALGWNTGDTVALKLTTGAGATPPPPPPPPTEVWSATLTVDAGSSFSGCGSGGLDACSDTSVLTDNEFDYGGSTYTITNLATSSNTLLLRFSGVTPQDAKRALSALTLNVGTSTFAIADAQMDSQDLYWSTSLGWTDGQTVSLSLTTGPAPGTTPPSAADWSPTLTVDQDNTVFGCDNTDNTRDNCSATTVLTEDAFTHGGATYTVRFLTWSSQANLLAIEFDGLTAAQAKTALTGLTLKVGSSSFAFSAATAAGNRLSWTASLGWTDGQTVSLGLTEGTQPATPTEVWSATLTVSDASIYSGCSDGTHRGVAVSGTTACSTALDDDDFEYPAGSGTTYTVVEMSTGTTSTDLQIRFDVAAATAKTALSGLTLEAGSGANKRTLAISDATVVGSGAAARLSWPYTNVYWTNNDQSATPQLSSVEFKLTTGTGTSMAPPVAASAPALEWARVSGAELALRFDTPLDGSSVPAASAFAVSVAGEVRAVSAVAVSQDTVTLTLASAVSSGETVTVDYTPPSTGKLRAGVAGGAAVAAFSGTAVTNDTPSEQPAQQGEPGAAGALTASVAQAPSEHRGKGSFTVRIAFSDDVVGKAKDAAATMEVSGGTLGRAVRVDGRADLWAVTLKPSGHGAVTLTLPATADCAAVGAVCTEDGRKLETALVHTVDGPVTLSVADARAKEGEDESIDFAVTLSRAASGEVTVRYATRDGTATKGEDYRRTRGTLAFAAGETEKTVPVPLLDDAVDEGEETFTLKLSKPTGAVIADGEATGTIENDDPMPAAWLARFGRTFAGQAVDAVTARLEGGGGSHVTLGGQQLSLDTAQGRAEAQADLEAVAAALGADAPGDGLDRERWLRGDDPEVSSRTTTGRELLLGSAFHLQAGGETGGPSFAAWGRVATGGFDGDEDGVTMNGEVTTGFLGADVASGRWLAGAAVSVSEGEGTFGLSGDAAVESVFDKGEVESTLTSVLPYALLELSDRVTAWALAGYGTGELTLIEKGEADGEERTKRYETDLTMTLGALGGRGTLVTPAEAGGFALALKSDAFWVRTESDATEGMAAAEADATRLRLTLDASRPFALGAGTLTPSLEVGLRVDGGDAETGTGVELGAGVGYGDPESGVSAELQGRWLAAHESSGYEEWGVAGSVRVGPGARGRGLSLTLAPTVGNAASGTGNLWSAADARALAPGGEFEAGRRFDAELGYGIAMFGDRFTGTPHLGVALTEAGRDYRLGWRLGLARHGAGSLEVGLDATRRESANDNVEPEHGVGFRATARW